MIGYTLRILFICQLACVVWTADQRTCAAADERLQPLINLREHHFSFRPPDSPQAWRARAGAVRRRVMVAAGLWPMPPRPTPHATVHGKLVRDGYQVEKVILESFPGHFVTGSLYRPLRAEGPCPGVLSPHGHWGGGRFHRWDDKAYADQLELDAEPPTEAGRHPLQARCVQLARMGCVVFLYDMLGYGDSVQLSQQAIHAPTEESILQSPDAWGFYSVQAELRLQGPLGVQTYNSMCALDWLASLSDVDPERIAVTGGSSGATQTLMLCAVDDRPHVAFPVVMVSNEMQGGCPCENACCLRMGGVSNVEIAALMAPKPLGIASADDWTRNFASDGYPQLKSVYRLLGVEDRLMHASLTQYPHNYNRASRTAMYAWMARWLELPANTPVEERDFEPLTQQELSVWDTTHAAPEGGREQEIALMHVMDQQSQRVVKQLEPHDSASLKEFQRIVGGAYTVLLDQQTTSEDAPELVTLESTDLATHRKEVAVVRRGSGGADIPAILLKPARVAGAVLWLSPEGKRGLFDQHGAPRAEVQSLLNRGLVVMGVDLIAQPARGDFQAPAVPGMRPAASLTYGYNPTIVARRVREANLALVVLRQLARQGRVGVVGAKGAEAYTAGLVALERENIDAVLLESGAFRFGSLDSWRDPDFVPGAVKYGDLPGLLALVSPKPLLVAQGTADSLQLTAAAYSAAGASDRLHTYPDAGDLPRAYQQFTEALAE